MAQEENIIRHRGPELFFGITTVSGVDVGGLSRWFPVSDPHSYTLVTGNILGGQSPAILVGSSWLMAG